MRWPKAVGRTQRMQDASQLQPSPPSPRVATLTLLSSPIMYPPTLSIQEPAVRCPPPARPPLSLPVCPLPFLEPYLSTPLLTPFPFFSGPGPAGGYFDTLIFRATVVWCWTFVYFRLSIKRRIGPSFLSFLVTFRAHSDPPASLELFLTAQTPL